MNVETKLAELGLKLPDAPKPVGNYSAFVRAGNLLFLSGQLPIADGALRDTGRVGSPINKVIWPTHFKPNKAQTFPSFKREIGRIQRSMSLNIPRWAPIADYRLLTH